jgi:hypothetical protein
MKMSPRTKLPNRPNIIDTDKKPGHWPGFLFWNFLNGTTLSRRNGEILLHLRSDFSTVSKRFRGLSPKGKPSKKRKEGNQAAHDLDPHRQLTVIVIAPLALVSQLHGEDDESHVRGSQYDQDRHVCPLSRTG